MILGNVAILPMAFGVKPIITVSWSLGYICLFYVLAPLIELAAALAADAVPGDRLGRDRHAHVPDGGRVGLLPLGVVLSKIIDRVAAPRWV